MKYPVRNPSRGMDHKEFGLGAIADSNKVVLVDTSATEYTHHLIGYASYTELRALIGRRFEFVPNIKKKTEYARVLKEHFEEFPNFMVTRRLSEQFEYHRPVLVGRLRGSYNEGLHYDSILKNMNRFISKHRILSFGEQQEENARMLSRFFEEIWRRHVQSVQDSHKRNRSNPASEMDFDTLVSGINAAAYIGNTAILTNDVPMLLLFSDMADKLNKGFYRECGLPYVGHSVGTYTMLWSGQFMPHTVFAPSYDTPEESCSEHFFWSKT
jgi:hypothetical protein